MINYFLKKIFPLLLIIMSVEAGRKKKFTTASIWWDWHKTKIKVISQSKASLFNCGYSKCRKFDTNQIEDFANHFKIRHVPEEFRNELAQEVLSYTQERANQFNDLKINSSVKELCTIKLNKKLPTELYFICNADGHGYFSTIITAATHFVKHHQKEIHDCSYESLEDILKKYIAEQSEILKDKSIKELPCKSCNRVFDKTTLLCEHPVTCALERLTQYNRRKKK